MWYRLGWMWTPTFRGNILCLFSLSKSSIMTMRTARVLLSVDISLQGYTVSQHTRPQSHKSQNWKPQNLHRDSWSVQKLAHEFWISDYHRGIYQGFCLLRYNAVSSGENQPRFGETYLLYLNGRRVSQSSNKLCLLPASCWFPTWPSLRLWRWKPEVPPKHPFGFHQDTLRYISEDRTLSTLSFSL
jgi:hypothetical protein